MTRKIVRNLVLTAAAAAGAAALVASGAPIPSPDLAAPAFAQQMKPEDLAAEWDKGWARANSDSAKAYESLYKWCNDNQLKFTAINTRRLVLRYDPQNEEVRGFVGYAKSPDGFWIRNENRRDQIRDESDIEDPKAKKYPEKLASADKKVAALWKALANKAKKNGELDAANAAAWAEKARTAWMKVLQVDSANEEAHKSLNHPKFAGKYVRPEALPFLKTRADRKEGGLKRANLAFKTAAVEMSGALPQAGLAGGGAKSDRFTVDTVHGKDVAAKLAVWAERSAVDFCEIYGVNAEVKDQLPYYKFKIVKDRDELKKVLKVIGMKDAEIERFVKFFGGGSNLPSGECTSTSSGGADSEDYVIHYTGHALSHAARSMAVRELGSPNEGVEDWLQESIAYDITRRLTGTTLTTCGDFGKYGTDIDPNPAKDIWIELAKRLVEYDDDVPLSKLWKLKHSEQNIGGPETVKGYAFVQFVFESDPEKGRKFIFAALAQGTPAAVEAVYGISMDELDAQYRDWITKSW